MLACGYLITFVTAYYNGLTTGNYTTTFNISAFGEQHIEMLLFGIIFAIILYSFFNRINQASATSGQTGIFATVGVITCVGICLLVTVLLNR
jgi:ABC-type transport system involved in multi-copper enzyme maturation permease subunit